MAKDINQIIRLWSSLSPGQVSGDGASSAEEGFLLSQIEEASGISE